MVMRWATRPASLASGTVLGEAERLAGAPRMNAPALTTCGRPGMDRKDVIAVGAALLLAAAVGAGTWSAQAAQRRSRALADAMERGDTDAVQAALARGADANTRNDAGDTLLMFACWHGDPDLVKQVLDQG